MCSLSVQRHTAGGPQTNSPCSGWGIGGWRLNALLVGCFFRSKVRALLFFYHNYSGGGLILVASKGPLDLCVRMFILVDGCAEVQ